MPHKVKFTDREPEPPANLQQLRDATRVVAPLAEWWRSGRALDSAARTSPAAERAWPPYNGQGRPARLAQRSGFAARPGLNTHVGPRRYSFERLTATTVFARLGPSRGSGAAGR
jgi:hypothetical protein